MRACSFDELPIRLGHSQPQAVGRKHCTSLPSASSPARCAAGGTGEPTGGLASAAAAEAPARPVQLASAGLGLKLFGRPGWPAAGQSGWAALAGRRSAAGSSWHAAHPRLCCSLCVSSPAGPRRGPPRPGPRPSPPTLRNPTCRCILLYAPVCGKDGKVGRGAAGAAANRAFCNADVLMWGRARACGAGHSVLAWSDAVGPHAACTMRVEPVTTVLLLPAPPGRCAHCGPLTQHP